MCVKLFVLPLGWHFTTLFSAQERFYCYIFQICSTVSGLDSLFEGPRVNKVEAFLFFIEAEGNIQTCYCRSLKALLVRREQLGGLHVKLVRSLRVTNHDFSPGFHRVGTLNMEKTVN